MGIQAAIQKVTSGMDLTREEARNTMRQIMDGQATPAQIAAFLVAEKMKSETYQEVSGFAEAMRQKATRVTIRANNAIDIVGTGGDKADTFNISTVAAFLIAAAGVPVAKHGNRSVSSKCGSADVLERLGIKIDLSPKQMAKCVDEVGIGFLFAPALHPAMRYALVPRKEIGIRTFFNILGPLTNPAGVTRQVTGAFDPQVARLMAKVLCELGFEYAMVVHGDDGLDEISMFAPTLVLEIQKQEIIERKVGPEDFGLPTQIRQGALGGTPEENAKTALRVLNGEAGVERDFVIANAACGLLVSGLAKDLKSAAQIAGQCLDSGAALSKLQALKTITGSFS